MAGSRAPKFQLTQGTLEGIDPTTAQIEIDEIKGVRLVKDQYGDTEERAIVYTLQECLDKYGDYYHPEYGWLRAGGKKEADPPMFDGAERTGRLVKNRTR